MTGRRFRGVVLAADESDGELVEAARQGDRAAYAMLAARHRSRLVAACRRVLGDVMLAEDAAQEAILRASLRLDRLRRAECFGPWLIGIGRNVCRGIARERQRTSTPPIHETDYVEQESDPATEYESVDLVARVREAVEALPSGQRSAVQLFYLAGLTYAETADELGIRPGAVRTRLHKARATLRRRLQALGKEEGMTEKREYKNYICSFCGKQSAQVRRMIAGPKGVVICNECVELCNRIIADEEAKDAREGTPAARSD